MPSPRTATLAGVLLVGAAAAAAEETPRRPFPLEVGTTFIYEGTARWIPLGAREIYTKPMNWTSREVTATMTVTGVQVVGGVEVAWLTGHPFTWFDCCEVNPPGSRCLAYVLVDGVRGYLVPMDPAPAGGEPRRDTEALRAWRDRKAPDAERNRSLVEVLDTMPIEFDLPFADHKTPEGQTIFPDYAMSLSSREELADATRALVPEGTKVFNIGSASNTAETDYQVAEGIGIVGVHHATHNMSFASDLQLWLVSVTSRE